MIWTYLLLHYFIDLVISISLCAASGFWGFRASFTQNKERSELFQSIGEYQEASDGGWWPNQWKAKVGYSEFTLCQCVAFNCKFPIHLTSIYSLHISMCFHDDVGLFYMRIQFMGVLLRWLSIIFILVCMICFCTSLL